MSTAVDHFYDTGGWPSMGLVQNAMVEQHDRSDAERLADRLPAAYGRRDEHGRVTLAMPGIYKAAPNHQMVDDFERSFGFVLRRYRRRCNPRVEATVSARDLVERLSFTEPQAERAIALLELEQILSPLSSGEDGFVIAPEIHHFRNVRNAREYVKVKARRDRQRCRAKKRNSVSRATIGDRKGIRKIILTALAAVLAAFVIWLGHQLWPTDGGPAEGHRKSAAAQRHRSSGGAAWFGGERRKRGAKPGFRAGRQPLALAGTR